MGTVAKQDNVWKQVSSFDYATDTQAGADASASHSHKTLGIYCAGCGKTFQTVLRCADRTCSFCRRRSYFSLVHAYLNTVKQVVERPSDLRLMLLTVKNIPVASTDYVRKEIDRIFRYFNLLRKRRYYRTVIWGGIRGVELVCKDGETWNLHMHILYEGHYIPVCCREMKECNRAQEIDWFEKHKCVKCKKQLCLRRDWLRYTKSSPVVSIKKAYGVQGGLCYILKYLTKSPTVSGYTLSYNLIMRGRRIVQPFGTWFDIVLLKDPYVCPDCGSVHWLSEFQVRKFSEIAAAVDVEESPIIDYDEIYHYRSNKTVQSLNGLREALL